MEWRWDPDPSEDTYLTDMAYVLRRADGSVEVAYDRHVMGLFPRDTWLGTIAAAGFEARTVPCDVGTPPGTPREVFVGLRRGGSRGPR